jgi:LDH2 family malate/lactate/ureidoglycolate dehydrogenase
MPCGAPAWGLGLLAGLAVGAWLVRRVWPRRRPGFPASKLSGVDHWVRLDHRELIAFSAAILCSIGCDDGTAQEVGEHLVESNLQSIDSHGVLRLVQYVEQAEKGLFKPAGRPVLCRSEHGGWLVDGREGFGMPALTMAVGKGLELMCASGSGGAAVVGVVNCGHTGRLNQFVDQGARGGALTIICGGGSRRCWRQVAPYGGASGLLPTNPWALGLPGDESGPVLLDFATSAVAGGWVMAALAAGATLPPGAIIDSAGRPSVDPEDYRAGGALLPAGGPKGFGLGLMAELLGGALLGKVATEAGLGLNMLVILVDTERFMPADELAAGVGAVLEEVRASPPAPGHAAVLVPGQWERAEAAGRRNDGVLLPGGVWRGLRGLAGARGLGGCLPTPLE